MADWGVPSNDPEHAVHACLAALEQQQTLADMRPRIRERYGVELHARIGINSGTVTAGNMGSAQRMHYTVVGDAVNLAARLEHLNKEFGSDILVSGETVNKLVETYPLESIGRIPIRGKSSNAEIYRLQAA